MWGLEMEEFKMRPFMWVFLAALVLAAASSNSFAYQRMALAPSGDGARIDNAGSQVVVKPAGKEQDREKPVVPAESGPRESRLLQLLGDSEGKAALPVSESKDQDELTIISVYPDPEPGSGALGSASVGTLVTTSGTVSSVLPDMGLLDLQTPYGIYSVKIPSYAVVRSYGRVITINDLPTGVPVTVTGRLQRPLYLVARTVTVGAANTVEASPYSAPVVVKGTIIRAADEISGTLTVRTPTGFKVIGLAPGGQVARFGETVSIFDLNRGDEVQVLGYPASGVFNATRISVVGVDNYVEYVRTGYIVRIDPLLNQFLLATGSRAMLVDMSNATIWAGRYRTSPDSLSVYDYVTVFGNVVLNRIEASRIVVRYW